ncbi:L,D-transpeptidase [uncultured Winogradskyella sp.]|uniref:L,D-transpeptidase n=1 Tax=uncultured Winogradskyella sp. TaxID=395353 RepID=UPI00260D4B32|nr:L,D-transpeptidase [uncultured Winogradskyella sp.]
MKRLVLQIHMFILVLCLVPVKSWINNKNVLSVTKKIKAVNQVYHQDSMVNLVSINKSITIENYFQFMDSLVKKHDSLTPYKLTEHLLVRSNLWIIDTFQNTDYYRMKAKDSFVYNQKKMIALPRGNLIQIPDSIQAKKLLHKFQNTIIDINIPEFKLRIYEDSVLLYQFPIRVGKNERKYLEMSGRIQDLKTKTGEGQIVNHFRNPRYINPVNNHEYHETKRDDGKVTKLPQIPFIETEINGLRYGQLIHPTTNPETLEKAHSNGCIGSKEADAWVIYYYAPINTRISIRYDLKIIDKKGNTSFIKDIYDTKNR